MQVIQELSVAEDEIRFKALLPCAKCSIYDLPDSDGMYCTLLAVTLDMIQIHWAGVTNMWRLQYSSNSNFDDKCVDYLLRSQ